MTFLLQRDTKKVRELEEKNSKRRDKLMRALKSIKDYQQIEKKYALEEGMDVSKYRAMIRKREGIVFDTAFLVPGNIEKMLTDLENEL
jgi:hypothetical protein